MTNAFDVAIIGGGIVGLAHAWMAARRGFRVGLFERSPIAQGASVRNFGMIWPIGQTAGPNYDLAIRSRELWLELSTSGVLDLEKCGSVHLAHREDELALLEEFCGQRTHDASMIGPDQVLQRTALANPIALLGGMYSSTELRVDPRTASQRLAAWLAQEHRVEVHFETTIVGVDNGGVVSADGRRWSADQTIVCSGSDLQTLYPSVFQTSELELCKLQMLRATAQRIYQSGSPHIASGLTLRHYSTFSHCSSFETLRRRIAHETPELDEYGIHVMASQFANGEVVLGDSHEYGAKITPFDRSEIDDLIIRELKKVIQLDDWTIIERWHGVYAKHPKLPVYQSETSDGNRVFVGTGGAGMTLSFGLADQAWNQWYGR